MRRHPISQSTSLKKIAQKPFFIIIISFVLAFAFVYAIPKEQVKANPLVAPVGLQLGAGVYVIGGLLIAGAAGAIGYEEHGEEIKAHSLRAWDNATELSKSAFNGMISAATGAGNAIQSFSTDALNFFESNLQNFTQTSMNIEAGGILQDGLNVITSFPSRESMIAINTTAQVPNMLVNGIQASAVRYHVTSSGVNTITITPLTGDPIVIETIKSAETTNTLFSIMRGFTYTGTHAERLVHALNVQGYAVTVGGADIYQEYQNRHARTQEVWESMRDAGLVLPVDNAVPITPDGVPGKYNADTDTYTGIDGGVYAPVDMSWQFPNIKWREKTDAIPLPGLWVDTPVVTGNPTYDDAITQAPTITHVTTGTTIANPDIPGSGGGTPTDPKPPGSTPNLPGTQPIIPIALFIGLFDLLRAILMYLARMFTFLMSIPFVNAIPIENPYFQWFRHAKILGVYPYSLVMSLATFFMSFAAYKSIRRMLP